MIITATLHPYDFADTGQAMPGFGSGSAQIHLAQWLDDLRAVATMDGVRFTSLQQLREAREDLSSARVQGNDALRIGLIASHHLLPEWDSLYPMDGVYYPGDVAKRAQLRQYAAVAAIAAAVFLTSWFATRAALRRFGSTWTCLRRIAIGTGLIGMAGIAFRSYFVGFYLVSGLALLMGLGLVFGGLAGMHRDVPGRGTGRR